MRPSAQKTVYLQDLQNFEKLSNNIRIISFYTNNREHLVATEVVKQSNGLASKEIFLCGPSGMMQSLKKQFKSLNKNIIIHSEEFSYN